MNATLVAPKPTAATTRQWSEQQKAIFAHAATKSTSLVVEALAGTGKTTTITEALHHLPESRVWTCAFAKRNAIALEQKLRSEGLNGRVDASTIHSRGFRLVRRYWEGVTLNHDRATLLSRAVCGDQAPDAIIRSVSKLHTLAREIKPFADLGTLEEIAFDFDLLPGDEWEQIGWDDAEVVKAAGEAMALATERQFARKGIDYADMLFLPVFHLWTTPDYRCVIVDEAQDMNAAQLAIATKSSDGRVIVVGDSHQAIYGFRGASSGAMQDMRKRLKADVLGLTTTYRCGKRIVQEAQQYVPHYEAHAGNEDGSVTELRGGIARALTEFKPGDAVLSRTNAPLVAGCLECLRNSVPARVEGRDIAEGLVALVRRLAKGEARQSVREFLVRLDKWQAREIEKALRRERTAESRMVHIQDRAEIVRLLAEDVSGVGEIVGRVYDLFNQVADGKCVTFSTVHRAKGGEWDRVFVLRDTLKPGTGREEDNICYVAITRARKQLTWIS